MPTRQLNNGGSVTTEGNRRTFNNPDGSKRNLVNRNGSRQEPTGKGAEDILSVFKKHLGLGKKSEVQEIQD